MDGRMDQEGVYVRGLYILELVVGLGTRGTVRVEVV